MTTQKSSSLLASLDLTKDPMDFLLHFEQINHTPPYFLCLPRKFTIYPARTAFKNLFAFF